MADESSDGRSTVAVGSNEHLVLLPLPAALARWANELAGPLGQAQALWTRDGDNTFGKALAAISDHLWQAVYPAVAAGCTADEVRVILGDRLGLIMFSAGRVPDQIAATVARIMAGSAGPSTGDGRDG